MSAFHWEARRRQAALDRRRAALMRAAASARMDSGHRTDTVAIVEASPPEPQPYRCSCPCHCTQNTSAKLPNRFSSVQYMQQW